MITLRTGSPGGFDEIAAFEWRANDGHTYRMNFLREQVLFALEGNLPGQFLTHLSSYDWTIHPLAEC